MKCVQIRSFFWSVFSPNAGKYGPEKTPYLDTFHAVLFMQITLHIELWESENIKNNRVTECFKNYNIEKILCFKFKSKLLFYANTIEKRIINGWFYGFMVLLIALAENS